GRDLLHQRALAPALLALAHRLHVAARTEALAGARHHDDAHAVVLGGARERVLQILAQRVTERVQALRAIEGERRDAVLLLVEHALVGAHARASRARRALVFANAAMVAATCGVDKRRERAKVAGCRARRQIGQSLEKREEPL